MICGIIPIGVKTMKKSKDAADAKIKLEAALCDYCAILLRNRLAEEGKALTVETLKGAAELYAEKLINTVGISAHNLIEVDMDNLRAIFERIKAEDSAHI